MSCETKLLSVLRNTTSLVKSRMCLGIDQGAAEVRNVKHASLGEWEDCEAMAGEVRGLGRDGALRERVCRAAESFGRGDPPQVRILIRVSVFRVS
jgi:hypothetical protein